MRPRSGIWTELLNRRHGRLAMQMQVYDGEGRMLFQQFGPVHHQCGWKAGLLDWPNGVSEIRWTCWPI